MPRTAFPLGAGRAYQLGSAWTWRVDVLAAGATECRLLTAFQMAKQGFMSMLVAKRGPDYVVIASYEFHGSHTGWHCHTTCGRTDEIDAGAVRPRGTMRFPSARNRHRRHDYEMSETTALNTALKFFRVTKPPADTLV